MIKNKITLFSAAFLFLFAGNINAKAADICEKENVADITVNSSMDRVMDVRSDSILSFVPDKDGTFLYVRSKNENFKVEPCKNKKRVFIHTPIRKSNTAITAKYRYFVKGKKVTKKFRFLLYAEDAEELLYKTEGEKNDTSISGTDYKWMKSIDFDVKKKDRKRIILECGTSYLNEHFYKKGIYHVTETIKGVNGAVKKTRFKILVRK